MSSKTKRIARNVKKQQSRMYMDSMEEIFSLSLFQELNLRRIYRKHMKKVRKEQKRILKLRQDWEND